MSRSLTEMAPLSSENQTEDARQYWDHQAATFDNEPDHGLHDPLIRDTWTAWLKTCLPFAQASILDIGCGTGSLSIVLASLGYDLTGVDVSPAMIALAEAKVATAGQKVRFHIMDAAQPQFSPEQFEVIVCRHVLWALPDLAEVLGRWVRLLKPGGRLVLIEGFWSTGTGLHATEIIEALPASLRQVEVQALSHQSSLWGRQVGDERYAVLADRHP